MNGVHDLGGMDGMGAIRYAPEEPTFHANWERQVFATVMVTMAQRQYNMDSFRHAIERMAPAQYLGVTYYERWLAAMEKRLVEEGVVLPDELADRIARYDAGELSIPDREEPALVSTMQSVIEHGGSARRNDTPPAFGVGDVVRVRNINPSGHTRCPRYVRRAEGTVEDVYGTQVLPDANAHGDGGRAEPLYSVRFDGDELWGPDAEANTSMSVDLWESYLEPIEVVES